MATAAGGRQVVEVPGDGSEASVDRTGAEEWESVGVGEAAGRAEVESEFDWGDTLAVGIGFGP